MHTIGVPYVYFLSARIIELNHIRNLMTGRVVPNNAGRPVDLSYPASRVLQLLLTHAATLSDVHAD